MLKKETLNTLEWLRDVHLQMLKDLDEKYKGKSMLEIKENGRKALEESVEALDDVLCELRMMPAINRDELMASLRYAQENLAVDYSGMDAQAVEKLDDALEAIFQIVSQLSACDKYGNCDFFKPKTQLSNDLIYHGNPMEWKETKEVSSWIPVSRGLPEKKGYYLTSTVFNEVYCDFWNGGRFARTEEILAWMPLPEPYKKEENA